MTWKENPLHNHIATRLRAASRVTSAMIVALVVSTSLATGQESLALSLEAHIPLPNVKGRIDHFSVDVKDQRLFVAAVENHTLEVIDLKSSQRVHTIADLTEPQGVFYDPSKNRLFVACGLDGVTKIFDVTTYQVLATVKFPDPGERCRRSERCRSTLPTYSRRCSITLI